MVTKFNFFELYAYYNKTSVVQCQQKSSRKLNLFVEHIFNVLYNSKCIKKEGKKMTRKVSTGTRLKQIMSELSMKQVDILEKAKPISAKMNVKISKTDLSQYVNGKTEPRQDKLYILAKALNVSEGWLMGFETPRKRNTDHNQDGLVFMYNQLDVPRQNFIYGLTKKQLEEQNKAKHLLSGRATAAGSPIDGDYQDSQQEIVVIRNEVPRGADEVVTIAGDSMEPLLQKGSQAFLHYQPVPDTDGQVVIVRIKDVGVTCKKIYREDGKIRLKSINDKYEDMVYPAQDVDVIGKIMLGEKKKP